MIANELGKLNQKELMFFCASALSKIMNALNLKGSNQEKLIEIIKEIKELKLR